MTNLGSLGPIARLAVALTAFAVGVCAGGVGHGQENAATQQPAVAAPNRTAPGVEHPARVVSAESEFEEALALRKKFTERDLESALRLLADSAQRFASSGRLRQAVAARLEAGDIHLMMSRYQQALAAYRQALTMSKDRVDQRCAALSRIARTYANFGHEPGMAQRYADQGVSVCMTIPDKKAEGDAFESQGETRFWLGNLTDAKTSFTQARELASQAGDLDGEWLATMMLSHTIRDHQQAKQLLWSALEGFAGSGNQYDAARAHLKLAYLASEEADFETARCHCDSALPVFQRIGDKDDAAIALNILGMVGQQDGDLEQSLEDYRRARRDFASVQDDLGELDSISAIADILLSQHRYGELEPLYVRKLHLAQSTSNSAFQAWALLDLAGVYARQHRYAKADETYQRGLAQYRSERKLDGESEALERMAGLQAELGKYQQALDLLGEAQSLRERLGEVEGVARVQYLRARLYFKLNDLEHARSEIAKTISIIESQRLRIAKFDSRAQYFASVHEYYSLYIQVLIGMEKIHPGQKYAQLAFEAAERSKVRSLLDLLENTQRTISCDTLLAGDSKSAAIEADQEASDTRALSSTQPLTLEDVQAQIEDANTLLLEFALGEDRSVAWVVDGDSLKAYDIAPAAEIRNHVRTFRKALLPIETKANEPPTDYLRRRAAARSTLLLQSRQLANLLLGPVHLPARRRLLIVPDGPLQYLPFAALSVAENGREVVPLVELHELAMLPSASALVSLRKTAGRRPLPADEVTVFADPVFEPPGKPIQAVVPRSSRSPRSRELTRALSDVRDSQWIPNLPGSRNEALAIQQITGSARTRLVMGFDANREAIMDSSLARQRIIHFATHGMMDTRHPEMSGLVLSMFNKRGEYQDGYLRLSDIYSLKLSADLVVLSSCESALGKDLGSEGIIGLPRAFLYAGARSVIASLWKVDDEATVPLMKTFYSRLQLGEDPARALQGAQLDLLKNARLSDPYYWAGFVLEGDYQ
jgi:CHAT domain-containing protein/predicted negative regulator of RcsB-dependent stress response